MKKLSIIYFVLLFLSSNSDASLITNFTTTWLHEPQILPLYPEQPTIGKDNIFIYDYCNPVPNITDWNYTINYEYLDYNDLVYNYKCFYQLQSINGLRISPPRIISHKRTKVLIVYNEVIEHTNGSFIYSVMSYNRMIDMPTCHYQEIESSIELENEDFHSDHLDYENTVFWNMAASEPSIIQNIDGSYEMFSYNHNLCKSARCRRIVYSDGTIDERNDSYLPIEYTPKKIKFHKTLSPDNYFVTIEDHLFHSPLNDQRYNLSLLYAWPGGKLEEFLYLVNQEGLYDFDGTENYLSACWSDKSDFTNITNVYCVQYNSKRVEVLRRNFVLPYNNYVLRIKNLENGGILLLTQECKSNVIEYNRCLKDGTYYVRNIQIEDIYSTVIEIDGFNLDYSSNKIHVDSLTTFISYQDRGFVCISIYFEDQNFHQPFTKKQYTRKCLPGFYFFNSHLG